MKSESLWRRIVAVNSLIRFFSNRMYTTDIKGHQSSQDGYIEADERKAYLYSLLEKERTAEHRARLRNQELQAQ